MTKKQKLDQVHIGGDKAICFNGKSDTAVLLLHGFTSSPSAFRKLAGYLSDRDFGVYAPVIAGHGSTPNDLSKTRLFDWKKSAEEAYLNLKSKYKNVFVVGLSFGGNLGTWLAANQDVCGLILIGTPVWLRYHKFIKFRLWLYGWAIKYYHKPKRDLRHDNPLGNADDKFYPLIPIGALKSFMAFVENETVSNLKKIKAPTIIIQATRDGVVHPNSARKIYEQMRNDRKFIHIVDSKFHDVSGSVADCQEVFEKINQFFNQILETDTEA